MKKYLMAGATLLLSAIAAQAQSGGWALVNTGGGIINGFNVTNAKHVATGDYVVQFNNDVSQCGISATISGRVQDPFPGQIVATTRKLFPMSVRITTFGNNSNQAADYRFYVVAQCF